ncbi:MAG: hypothetical protein E6Q89_02010 [Bacteroidia bacterium]|nr:MAG: hypothetical protein E6Q89_02010 [Bacteroidia bacterium]
MSHGSLKHVTWTDRVNRIIARMLGKRSNFKKPDNLDTSSLVFVLTIIFFAFLMWFSTGFYYLGENQFGILQRYGLVQVVVKGVRVGFTWPYPFGGIEIMDSGVSKPLQLGRRGQDNSTYIALSKDQILVAILGQFTYQLVDPKSLFINYYQDQEDFDNLVRIVILAQLHQYIIQYNFNDLIEGNLTVIAEEIAKKSNALLHKYGITLVRLKINGVSGYTFKDKNSANDQQIKGSDIAIMNSLQMKALQIDGRVMNRKVERDRYVIRLRNSVE